MFSECSTNTQIIVKDCKNISILKFCYFSQPNNQYSFVKMSQIFRKQKETKKQTKVPLSSRRSRPKSLRSGYAFSHDRGFGNLITTGTMKSRSQDKNHKRGVGGKNDHNEHNRTRHSNPQNDEGPTNVQI